MIDTPDIKVLQINLNKSQQATESALQLAIELQIDIIFVQEPWLIPKSQHHGDYRETRSVNHQNFIQILPNHNSSERPRTLVYVAKKIRSQVLLAPNSPRDPDFQELEMVVDNSKITLINIYNQIDQLTKTQKTTDRCLFKIHPQKNTIIMGDFNIHHPLWESLASISSEGEELMDWMDEHQMELLNIPGEGTFYRPHMSHATVIDLTFASGAMSERIQDWQVIDDIGSDHLGILFTVVLSRPNICLDPLNENRFNTRKADWTKFATSLQNMTENNNLLSHATLDIHSSDSRLIEALEVDQPRQTLLDDAAEELTNCIKKASQLSIPVYSPIPNPKPWWTSELKDMRKIFTRAARNLKKQSSNFELKEEFLSARNAYFTAIKKAKQAHWNEFLENESPKAIYQAMSYTKTRLSENLPAISQADGTRALTFQEKCNAFRKTLFPRPPNTEKLSWKDYKAGSWDWPPLSKEELQSACSANIKGKTPGPDMINQDIIINAYKAIPDIFYRVFSALLHSGYHPKCWKQANGIILKKPSKPDYTQPKAYRVISLLNCLGKVSERVLAKRLGYLAETSHLLDPSQIGGRLKKSAIDAALLLTNEVEVNKQFNLRTSALFLDVKGAFDHVSMHQLLGIFKKLRLPLNLISWVASFLQERSIRLTFDGNIEVFSQIETGIPQGSPISPILFLIYLQGLFKSNTVRFISYIDDIVMIAQSTSFKKNIQILEREATELFKQAKVNAIQFDLSKTELMHFSKEKDAKRKTLHLPNGAEISPKESIRWLGIWFDPCLTFKTHITLRTAQATQAFYRMCRLANVERGLSPKALRQIYRACVVSVSDYGSVIWWRGQQFMISSLQRLHNIALRKILGVFKTAPIIPMEIEAALPPPQIRLDSNRHLYAFRLATLPRNHPINLERYNHLKLTKPTQIKLIKKSIPDLPDQQSLEKISHFVFPPWGCKIPFSVNIMQAERDTILKAHILESETMDPENNTRIYTDASMSKDSTGIGVAMIATGANGKFIYKKARNIGPNAIVYNGELEAIAMAAEFAAEQTSFGHQYHIYSDSQAALHRLNQLSDQHGQQCQLRIVNACTNINQRASSLHLHWIPGHNKIEGNLKADQMAKEVSLKPPDINFTTFAMIKITGKEQMISAWTQYINKKKAKLKQQRGETQYDKKFPFIKPSLNFQLPKNTTRKVASAFFQLKLGHGYNRSYLHRLGHVTSDRCECGKKETPEHLLLCCNEYNSERLELKEKLNNNRLNFRLLMHTSLGIKYTIEFIKNTTISTRQWYLSRGIA